MATQLKSKPGITGASTLSIPKDWDPTWFRHFVNNVLKGADVRNAVGANGITVSGTIASPYATIAYTGVGSVVGTPNEIAVSTVGGVATISFAPNVIIPAPPSGTTLTVNGAAGVPAGIFNGANDVNGRGLAVIGNFTGGGTIDLVTFSDVNNTNGVNILLAGNGVTNPNKFIRVIGGQLQFVNSAYSATPFQMSDSGAFILTSSSGNALVVNGDGANTPAWVFAGGQNQVLALDSTQANGPYMIFTLSGSAIAYIGDSTALGGNGGFLGLRGQTGVDIITNAGTHLAISANAAGNVVVNAPSSGTTLTVNVGSNINALFLSAPAASQINAITIQQSGQSSWIFYQPPSSNDLRLFSASDRVIISGTGNVTVSIPTGGSDAVSATAFSSHAAFLGQGNNTGTSTCFWAEGVAATKVQFMVMNQSGQGEWIWYAPASSNDLHLFNSTLATDNLSLSGAGNVTLNSPSSGVTLIVNTATGGSPQQWTDGTVLAQVFLNGPEFQIGTVSNHIVSIFANDTNYLNLTGNGGFMVGSPQPSGGTQGNGTINVSSGYYINGTPLPVPTYIRKTSSETRTNTTTLSNDAALVYAVPAAGTYEIEVFFQAINAAAVAAGIAWNLNYSGTFTQASSPFSAFSASSNTLSNTLGLIQTAQNSLAQSVNVSLSSINAQGVFIKGTLLATGTGTLGLAWAQQTASANTTTMEPGAYMKVTKIA